MGGSGGRSYPKDEDADEVRRQIRELLQRQEADAELNDFLAEQLASFNDRDVRLVQARLDELRDALGGAALEIDKLLFGGSVAKHTYVDGLSDVDALVILEDPDASPSELVERFARVLSGRLGRGDVVEVSPGGLAATVTYADGTQIQLLPAVERDGHTSIASEDGAEWRRIRPHKFAEKLTAVNAANGAAVVPTIKLAKAAIAAALPEAQRLSGYHVEAIAVDAFKGYDGRRDRISMLRHMVAHAAETVLRPTGDITGQSVHVDAYMGAANSPRRQGVSSRLHRLAARLASATSAADLDRVFDE